MAEIMPTMGLERHAQLGALVGKPTANNVMRMLRDIYNLAMVMDDSLARNPVLLLVRSTPAIPHWR